MTNWNRSRLADIGLRVAGMCACGLAYASIAHLMRLRDADPKHWAPNLLGYTLAAIGFLSVSAGGIMLTLGRHIFDKIEISERWRTNPQSSSQSQTTTAAATGNEGLSEKSHALPIAAKSGSLRREGASLLLRRTHASVAYLRQRPLDELTRITTSSSQASRRA